MSVFKKVIAEGFSLHLVKKKITDNKNGSNLNVSTCFTYYLCKIFKD